MTQTVQWTVWVILSKKHNHAPFDFW